MANITDPKGKDASNDAEPESRRRGRSPSYPGVSLGQAIEHTTTIFQAENRHEAAESTLLGHLGYTPKSGLGLVAIAALKAFCLVEVNRESNLLKVTNIATKIILDTREDDTDRLAAIQVIAVNPPMHKVMWEKYKGQLPSDANMLFLLQHEYKFTESGAKQFIRLYRETLAFARLLGSSDILSGRQGDKDAQEVHQSMTTEVPAISHRSGSLLEVPIPIAGTMWPSLKAAFPMSEEAWDQMLQVLKAMKGGLVRSDDAGGDDDPKGA